MLCLTNRAGSIFDAMNQYTAAIQKDGELWIGWIEELPGVNSQADSREALLDELRSALSEALEMHRQQARSAAGQDFEEVCIIA